MEKPTIETVIIKRLGYRKVISYIEQKYNINTGDYLNKFDKDDYKPDVEFQDFWGYLTDVWDDTNINGSNQIIPIQDILCNNLELLDWIPELAPLWVKEIAQLIKDEFGDLLDDEGNLEVYVCW